MRGDASPETAHIDVDDELRVATANAAAARILGRMPVAGEHALPLLRETRTKWFVDAGADRAGARLVHQAVASPWHETLAYIAHDLANLFTVIAAGASSPNDERQAIGTAAQLGAQLLGALRGAVRATGRGARARDVIETAATLLGALARARGITLVVCALDEVEAVVVPAALQHILLELGLGAIEAGERGDVIRIDAALDAGTLRLAIAGATSVTVTVPLEP